MAIRRSFDLGHDGGLGGIVVYSSDVEVLKIKWAVLDDGLRESSSAGFDLYIAILIQK